MKPTKNLKNILSLFSVDLGTKFLGFLATTYLARVLGTSGFGAISIGLSVLVYIQILSTSGLTLIGTKAVASGSEKLEYLSGKIIFNRFMLSLSAFLFIFLIVIIFVTSDEIKLMILIYALYAFPSAFLLDWYFSGLQKLGITSTGRMIGSSVYLIALVILVKDASDILNTAAAWIVGGTANTIFIWYLYKRSGYKIKIDFKRYKETFKLLKESISLGMASLLSQIAISFPAIYLGIVSGTSDAGIYSASFKLVSLLLLLDNVFVTIFFPKIVTAYSQIPEKLEEIFNRVLKVISILVFGLGIPAAIAGEKLIAIVFGEQFGESALIFRVMIIFFAGTMINSVLSYTLIAVGREKAYTFALFLGTAAYAISIVTLYPQFYSLGIVFALIIYEIIQMMVMIIKIRKTLHVKYFINIILPAAAAAVIIYLLINLEAVLPIKIAAGIAAGIPLIAFAARLKIEDVKYLKRLLF